MFSGEKADVPADHVTTAGLVVRTAIMGRVESHQYDKRPIRRRSAAPPRVAICALGGGTSGQDNPFPHRRRVVSGLVVPWCATANLGSCQRFQAMNLEVVSIRATHIEKHRWCRGVGSAAAIILVADRGCRTLCPMLDARMLHDQVVLGW